MLHASAGRTDRPRHRASRSNLRFFLPSRGARRRRRPHRHGLPVAGLALAVAVAACGLWWMSTHRTVTLLVDGQLSHHDTHAATVADFLDRAGVDVVPGDHVVPSPQTPLRHGMRVEVVSAREVTLLIGDTREDVVVTALTVDDLLAELGAAETLGERGARRLLRPSRLARLHPGTVVELSDPVALTLLHDGRRKEVITTDRTVGDLLERLDVGLGSTDRVSPGPGEPVSQGLVVTVERVDVALEARQEPIAYGVEERPTSRLQRGQRRVARAGVEGRLDIVEQVVVVDGVEEVRRPLNEQLVAGPVSEIIEVGTAAPPPRGVVSAPAPSGTSGGAADSTAGDDPQDGPEDSPEDRAPGNVEVGQASWYDNPFGGYTAAHRTLPRGTIVRVVNVANGRSVQVRINDRGPYVAGRVIDLNRKAFAELAPPSRGIIQVRIEW